jgi:hypothetical protein
MPTGDLVSVLCLLCEMEPPEITGQGIRESIDRITLTSLVELGALVQVGNSESVLCFACDHPHSIAVESAGAGQYRAYCADSGYQPLRPEDIRRLVVAENWIVRTVRSTVGLRHQSAHLPTSAVAWIGKARFGPYPCDLFFGRRLFEGTRFDEAKRTISGSVGKAPAILLTTTPVNLIRGEPAPRCAVVPLWEALGVTTSEISLNEGPIYSALRGGNHRFDAEGVGFFFSPGFRSAIVGDQEYSFSDKQALAIEALYEAWHGGNPRLHQNEIKGAAHTSQRVGQLFSGHPAYNVLIKHDRSGFYWLDL